MDERESLLADLAVVKAERDRYREALRAILLHEYNGATANENMRSIARQALEEAKP